MWMPENDPATFPLEFIGILALVILCEGVFFYFLKRKDNTNPNLWIVIDDFFILFYIVSSLYYIREFYLLLVLLIVYVIYTRLFKSYLKRFFTFDHVETNLLDEDLKQNLYKKIRYLRFIFLVRDVLENVLKCIFLYSAAYLLQGFMNIPLYGFYIFFYVLWTYKTLKEYLSLYKEKRE